MSECETWRGAVGREGGPRRVRTDHAAQNLAVLRYLALNLLRRESTSKVGLKAIRLMAGWDETYLRQVLAA